jgi:uncharacterized protein (DUF1810 family)
LHDPFDLARFVAAQDGVYEHALEELRSGTKRSHWMWFVFPQLKGLGRSATATRYAIGSLAEARAYLAHPLLGLRLRECTAAVNALRGRSLAQIFGSPDDMKFCSSMTLFDLAASAESEFSIALEKYCSGRRDSATLRLLEAVRDQNRKV